jgi:hypothetical protein
LPSSLLTNSSLASLGGGDKEPESAASSGGGFFGGGKGGRNCANDHDNDGEDSDPEDSETPWICTVKVRRSGPSTTPSPRKRVESAAHSRTSSKVGDMLHPHSNDEAFRERQEREREEREKEDAAASAQAKPIKLKAATLSPTPHHPKVVAMLKVPFPLPDVSIDYVETYPRSNRFAGPTPNSLAQTKEELEKMDPEERAAKEREQLARKGLMFTAEEIKDVVCSTGLWLVVREGFGGIGKVARKGDGWRIRA